MNASPHSASRRRACLAAGALLALMTGLVTNPAMTPAVAVAPPLTEGFESASTPSTAPAGWNVESSGTAGMRAGWEGWTFHTTAEVVSAFGNSGDRNSFGKAKGLVAVVQSDTNRPTTGTFDSTLWAPSYSVDAGAQAVSVSFDNHYKQGQAPQEAKLVAKIDGGAPVVVEQFSTNRLNQSHSYSVSLPAGAAKVQFGWQYTKSTNNWFWMIDNVSITEAKPADAVLKIDSLKKPVTTPGGTTTVSVSGLRAGQQLQASLGAVSVAGIPVADGSGKVSFDVTVPADQAQATVPLTLGGEDITPAEMTITVLNEIPSEAYSTEPQLWWDGFDGTVQNWTATGSWGFMTRAEMTAAYGLDRRHTFTRASGVIALAETAGASAAPFDGKLTSAPVAVTARDEVELRFDSHFRVRGSGAHRGIVTVKFDKGDPIELRTITAEEESAQPRLPFTVPAGATQATVEFAYTAPASAGSWMLDDVQIVKPLTPLAKDAQPEAIVDVFSDVQGAAANVKLQNQVLPGFRNLPGGRASTVISNGDLTSNGTAAQYDDYFKAFNAGGGNDYGTKISTIGNHEFYGSDGSETYIKRFLDKTGMRELGVADSASPHKGLWGETLVDGTLPVLWIGSERHEYHGGSGPFVEIWDEQYNWLRDRLDHYRESNTPVLLSVHHIFENSVSGSYANLYKREFGDDQERMERLLAAYPNVTVMSSHTHWSPKLNDWSVEQRFVPTADHAPTIINTAAVTTQYGPSGDWGEAGVGGADPAGLRIALYEDRLRATVYGFNGSAEPTEIKHIDIARPTAAPIAPAEPEVQVPGAEPGVPVSVKAGDKLQLAGNGFKPREALSLELHGGPVSLKLRGGPVSLGAVTVDDTGTFVAEVTVPADTQPGDYTIVVLRGGVPAAQLPIVVAAADGGADSGAGGADAGAGAGGADGTGPGKNDGTASNGSGANSSGGNLVTTGGQGAVVFGALGALLLGAGVTVLVIRLRKTANTSNQDADFE